MIRYREPKESNSQICPSSPLAFLLLLKASTAELRAHQPFPHKAAKWRVCGNIVTAFLFNGHEGASFIVSCVSFHGCQPHLYRETQCSSPQHLAKSFLGKPKQSKHEMKTVQILLHARHYELMLIYWVFLHHAYVLKLDVQGWES